MLCFGSKSPMIFHAGPIRLDQDQPSVFLLLIPFLLILPLFSLHHGKVNSSVLKCEEDSDEPQITGYIEDYLWEMKIFQNGNMESKQDQERNRSSSVSNSKVKKYILNPKVPPLVSLFNIHWQQSISSISTEIRWRRF